MFNQRKPSRICGYSRERKGFSEFGDNSWSRRFMRQPPGEEPEPRSMKRLLSRGEFFEWVKPLMAELFAGQITRKIRKEDATTKAFLTERFLDIAYFDTVAYYWYTLNTFGSKETLNETEKGLLGYAALGLLRSGHIKKLDLVLDAIEPEVIGWRSGDRLLFTVGMENSETRRYVRRLLMDHTLVRFDDMNLFMSLILEKIKETEADRIMVDLEIRDSSFRDMLRGRMDSITRLEVEGYLWIALELLGEDESRKLNELEEKAVAFAVSELMALGREKDLRSSLEGARTHLFPPEIGIVMLGNVDIVNVYVRKMIEAALRGSEDEKKLE